MVGKRSGLAGCARESRGQTAKVPEAIREDVNVKKLNVWWAMSFVLAFAVAGFALSAEEKTSVEDPLEMERLADALPAERTAKRWIVSCEPEEHVERIRPYVELGFRHLVFHAPGPDQARFIRLYAAEVLPRLRKAFG